MEQCLVNYHIRQLKDGVGRHGQTDLYLTNNVQAAAICDCPYLHMVRRPTAPILSVKAADMAL
ncbi:MAG: hypothetical protein GY696_08440 [Gammaproteobacteria bacterium]|nr:hypothetical protein [Gammaproteobacteria bacterium]